MAVPPIQYRTTDYPPKYRPLGYWRHQKPEVVVGDEKAPPDRRRRFLLLLAVLVATLVLHAGIAAAYLGDGSSGRTSEQAAEADDPGAACEDPGQQDATGEESLPFDEVPAGDTGAGAGTSTDPGASGGSSRGAL